MMIHKITVSLEPAHYEGYTRLNLQVKAMNEVLNLSVELRETDIETRFDQYFDRAKTELLNALKKYEEQFREGKPLEI